MTDPDAAGVATARTMQKATMKLGTASNSVMAGATVICRSTAMRCV